MMLAMGARPISTRSVWYLDDSLVHFPWGELDFGGGGDVSTANRSVSSPNTARRTLSRCTAHGCG